MIGLQGEEVLTRGQGQERGGKSESEKIEGGGTSGSNEGGREGMDKEGGWTSEETTTGFRTGEGLDTSGSEASTEEGRVAQPSIESKRVSSCLEASSKKDQALK